MSGNDNCYDDADVETVFKTIKAEPLWQRSWRTRRGAEVAIFEYINGFYNPRRLYSALGRKSPVQQLALCLRKAAKFGLLYRLGRDRIGCKPAALPV